MANRTDPLARSVHGTNPQNLVEKIVRMKVYTMPYWKEHCFGLNAESLVDKAMELDHIGGTYGGNKKAANFLCLVLKMLQIQPEKEIVVEFIKNEDYKYVRMLGAFYMRLVGSPLDVYQYLEPLYNDYRKLRQRADFGNFELTHVDEFVDEMLTKDFLCDIALPRIPNRWTLEASMKLEPRRSALEEDFEEELEGEEDIEAKARAAALELEMVREDARRGYGGGGGVRDYSPPPRDRLPSPARTEQGRDHEERDKGRERARERSPARRREGRERRDVVDERREREQGRERDPDRSTRRSRSPARRRGRDDQRRDENKRRKHSRSASPPPERSEKKEAKEKSKDSKKKKVEAAVDPEIAEANALRAKLGLKPLK